MLRDKVPIEERQSAEQLILSKDVLGMLINLVAAHRNRNPSDDTAAALHVILGEAWSRAEWLPETRDTIRKVRAAIAQLGKTR